MSGRARGVIVATAVGLTLLALPLSAHASFGFMPGDEGFEMVPEEEAKVAAVAGSHPFELRAKLAFNTTESPAQPGVSFPDGDPRALRIELPPGLLANPQALQGCPVEDFASPRISPFELSASAESCPDSSQVGTVDVSTVRNGDAVTRRFGVFNLAPPPGIPAELGFAPFGSPIALALQIESSVSGEYSLSLEADDLPQSIGISALEFRIWGTPWAAIHDGERGSCLNEVEPTFPWSKCSVGSPVQQPPQAFLTMPTRCEGPMTFKASASAWQGGSPVSASFTPAAVLRECGSLAYEPTSFGQLTNHSAGSSSGFAFDLVNKSVGLVDPASLVQSQARQAVVTLPEGATLNPSLGAGLGVCTPAQLGAEKATEPQGTGCPNGSKIGSFSVRTPLFDRELQGAIYLAEPDDPAAPGAENPFDSLLAVYLVAKSPVRGVLIEVAGKLTPDPQSGRITATFENLPQLPYDELEVNFKSGQRAPIVTPAACGAAATEIDLAPWAGSAATARSTTVTPIEHGVAGGPCPSGAPPFSPRVVAGSINSNVGSYTPFYLHMSRGDSEQEITSYSAVLPKGITGRLAGIPFCSDAAIAAARSDSGFAETANPSCPQASQVGRTFSGYGVGAALTYAPGRIYLAGPYHGQPLSLVTINAATIGPFDLGTIVIRSAFSVEPTTAQLAIDSRASDPIPHIIDGIPLHLREIRVIMDRREFTRNPSSCEPSEVVSTLTGSGARFGDSADDSTAVGGNHFQLLNCRTLDFKPKLGIRLRGPSHRRAYPSLRATFASRGDLDSNLKTIEVTMPHSEFLASNHIGGICTREQFAAERCPPNSVYGKAVAYTPLFDEPLRGDVYLRSSDNTLPDLVASLRSGSIRIVLDGKIGPAKGGIRVQFENLPDAPLSRFVMTMSGGKHGLLVNSTDICARPPLATVKALGQNNLGAIFTTRLRGQCKGKGKKPHHGNGGQGK